jgi:transcriptional regulator with XRE-family HTH domain
VTTPLGELIRRQRELQELSMRQLADLVGISNPYLSQIERGLREPSERVLGAIAENLELSADALREHGRRDEEADEEPAVVAAIRADPRLTARQRQALLEVYAAFVDRDRRIGEGPARRRARGLRWCTPSRPRG